MSRIKERNKRILMELFEACDGGKLSWRYAQDYLTSAKAWKFMVDNKSRFTTTQAKHCLINYKNNRDRLMLYCRAAVEAVDKYFPIKIDGVQTRPDTPIAKLAGAKLDGIKE